MKLKEVKNVEKTITLEVSKEELLAIKNSIANLSQEVEEIDYTTLLGVTVEEIRKIEKDLKEIYSNLKWEVSKITK